jgi:hypothetical protein
LARNIRCAPEVTADGADGRSVRGGLSEASTGEG